MTPVVTAVTPDTPPKVTGSGFTLCKGVRMAQDYRSSERVVGVPFRMTEQERANLETEMRAEGYSSLQQLFEARIFGKAKPRRKPGPQPQAERLDISA